MGSQSSMNPGFNPQIFRADRTLILACDRHLAVILPVPLRFNANGVAAGTVVARNTTDGVFDSYASGGSSGTNVPYGITLRTEATVSGDTVFTPCIVKGIVYYDNLTGIDANAVTSLGARKIVAVGDANSNLLIF